MDRIHRIQMRVLLRLAVVIAPACLLAVAMACMHQQRPDSSATVADARGGEQPVQEVVSENGDIAGYCTALRNSSDPFFGTQQRERLMAELENPIFLTCHGA